MSILIRTATSTDATEIGQLAEQLAAYLRGLGDSTNFQFNAETYRRDGFGPNPAFAGLVAEADGQVIGYLLYHFGYDTDLAIRVMYVIDLYVREDARGQGAGTALMHEAARICQEAGGHALTWAVYATNRLAARFYERLGARYIEDLKWMVWLPV
jgi:ribosomal protein S18 acetylase RimI-like enzyme